MEKIVFFILTTSLSRFKADLNSSLAQSTGECCPYKEGVFQPKLGFVGTEIFTNFCFFIHNFGYRHARKPFKGIKDAYFCLVSEKKLEPK